MSEKKNSLSSEHKKLLIYLVYVGIVAIVIFGIWRIVKIHDQIASAAVPALTGWTHIILLIVFCVLAGGVLLYASQLIQQKRKLNIPRMNFIPRKKERTVSTRSEEILHTEDSSVQETINRSEERSNEPSQDLSPELKSEVVSGSDFTVSNPEEATLLKITPAFQENNCCICNGSLEDGYSILFKANNGAEARIDKKCRSALRALSKCEDVEEVLNAGKYLSSYYLSVAPIVLPHLDGFLQKGSDYLRENKNRSKPENDT